MSISFSGLSSNIDTAAIVDQLIQVESIPQLQLQSKVKAQRSEISALQDLNTRIAALATTAKDLAKSDALALFTGTSTSDSVTVAAGAGASAGSIDVVVDRVAPRRSPSRAP
ncbi:flagellar cap protein FliD N-terminal domain-containing protein [Cellulosimicrobium sp. CUA-896]|uniref:flagellar cap protein FliD N-terminal domain-containing protein n=1 Tax=Cellulosimicrobium sp. CUA-896 TaxID=1517881 RepID=UPI000A812A80|nr:flagellar cap protein FliD N-terminal domain-containing protein [Cellulosimicrobium sp. CUA-896]